jgi:hypothetical protein|tara:strand:+ start:94 stop:315 length:222 start_codon:yes stop_codon:yes gene_type:complete
MLDKTKLENHDQSQKRNFAENRAAQEWLVIKRFPKAWKKFNALYVYKEGEKPYVRRKAFVDRMAELLILEELS